MNPFIKKEIRLLLPSFLIGIVVIFFSEIFGRRSFYSDSGLVYFALFVFCPAIAVFMALNSFGAEISAGVFPLLLAQPVSRRHIWRVKTSLLAGALLVGGIMWNTSVTDMNHPGEPEDFTLSLALFLLAIYTGAQWTVLLLRQVAAAFWFTILAPCAIMVPIFGLLGDSHPGWISPMLTTALGIYSVGGFIFARRLFLRAQDVQWSGGIITLPEMPAAASFLTGAANQRRWRPWAALFRKELQLHQSQFVIAAVLLVLHLAMLALRHFGNIRSNTTLGFIIETFWGLWLVMPLLVGAAAISEERKLGTLGPQLGLPVTARTQFRIKLSVVLLLSLLFGMVLPLGLEGSRLSSDSPWQLILLFGAVATGTGLIAFYASSCARNTLQTLAPSLLLVMIFTFLGFIADGLELSVTLNKVPYHFLFWRGLLVYLIGVPVFVLALVRISFGNFQRLIIGWPVWWRNLLGFMMALIITASLTTAVFHRAWEKLTPLEPVHDAARLTLPNPATLETHWNLITIRLPDGKVSQQPYFPPQRPTLMSFWLNEYQLTYTGADYYYPGSNWVNLVHGDGEQIFGLKTDGTLWFSPSPPGWQSADGRSLGAAHTGNFQQVGTDTNWTSLAAETVLGTDTEEPYFYATKGDGTLWRWRIHLNTKDNPSPSPEPSRVGTGSDWAAVDFGAGEFCFHKTDGSSWQIYDGQELEKANIAPHLVLGRLPYWPRQSRNVMIFNNRHFAITDTGTFCLLANLKISQDTHLWEWNPSGFQFAGGTNWLALAGAGSKIVTLKNDGSLWLWNYPALPEERENIYDVGQGWLGDTPTRLGTHSDWIAITGLRDGILCLAADGSLWHWRLLHVDNYAGVRIQDYNSQTAELITQPLLDISDKPQFFGNVFSMGN